MVALTPRCALELGYEVSEEDRARPYIEVSGRKGFGVKADDLIDKLVAATRAEVDSRHPELSEAERDETATAIAVGALRYFMLRYTRNSVIAFDFKDALSFEGETGPYLQYAVVRTRSIFRKAGTTADEALSALDGRRRGAVSERRGQRGHLGGVAAGGEDDAAARSVHCDGGAGVSGEACVSAGAGLQQFLPAASHSERRGSGAEEVAAGDGGGDASGSWCGRWRGWGFGRRT